MFSQDSIASLMDIAIYIALLVGLGLNLLVIKSIGKGVLNIVFISFGFSIFFVAMSNVFVLFQDFGMYKLTDVTLHIWWHTIVYLAFISLIWGGYRIKKIADTASTQGFHSNDVMIFGAMLNIMVIIFIAAPLVESSLAPVLVGSFVDTLGLHHVGAFILGGIAGWYLFYIKGHWGILGVSILFIIGFLLLLGTQHLWETLTESWKIIKLEDESIELVEQFIVLPALLLFVIGQWKIFKSFKS